MVRESLGELGLWTHYDYEILQYSNKTYKGNYNDPPKRESHMLLRDMKQVIINRINQITLTRYN
jgi:hypothetical protein